MSGVQSVERAFAVLRCLSVGPAGVTDLAERVNLPKSTVSRLLSTLEELGMVEQTEPGGSYRIGPGMTDIAAASMPGRSLIAAVSIATGAPSSQRRLRSSPRNSIPFIPAMW